jgi:hypothetical protein
VAEHWWCQFDYTWLLQMGFEVGFEEEHEKGRGEEMQVFRKRE